MTGADEDSLERSEAKVVVRLGRELLGAEVEERDHLGRQRLGSPEPLREQHHLSDQLQVRLGHRHALGRADTKGEKVSQRAAKNKEKKAGRLTLKSSAGERGRVDRRSVRMPDRGDE